MKTFTALLVAGGMWLVPAHAHNVRVFIHGHKTVRMADPAYDTCNRQASYVRSHKDLRIVAEIVWCFTKHGEVDNFTMRRLRITYQKYPRQR